jgi:dienelactone hydrolase
LYPGCKALQKKDLWVPVIPTTILAGGADEWTPSAACVSLVDEAKKKGAQAEITIYQGAHHGFDAPDTPLHTKTDLAYSSRTDGTAVVGTDSAARDDAIRRVTELFERALTP